MEDGDFEKAQQSILSYTPLDLAALPDSVLFDYYYLKAAIRDNQGNIGSKIKYLKAAKDLCEQSQGIHSPVYLELCWSIGKELIAKGDSVGAFEIYQAAMIQSIGLYDMSDEDVEWQYNDIQDYVRGCYKSPNIRAAMINHRGQLSPRKVEEDAVQNDMEFYLRFYKDENLKSRLQTADSVANTNSEEAAGMYRSIAELINDNVIAKATVQELAAINYINVNDFQSAETLLLDNLHILGNRTKAKTYRRSLSLLANVYIGLHNYDKAKHYASQAKFWFEHNLDFSRAYILCLHRCANLELGNNNLFLSILLADVALQEYHKNQVWGIISGKSTEREGYYANMLSTAALIYNRLGFNSEALANITAAIDIANNHGWDATPYYNNLAEVYVASGDFSNASQASMEAFQRCDDANQRVEVGTSVGIYQWLSRQPIDSRIAKESAIGLRSQVANTFAYLSADERRDYWNYFQYHLPMLNFLLYQSGDTTSFGDIYNNVLQEKGLLLRTSTNLRDAIARSGNTDDLNAYDNLLQLRQIKSTLNKDIDNQLGDQIDLIDKYLTRKYSAFADFKKDFDVTWQDISSTLKDGEIAIEFYNIPKCEYDESGNAISAYRYCAITLKNNYASPHIIPLCLESDINALPEDDLYETTDLYMSIWAPLMTEFDGVHKIYFSGYGDLHKYAIEYAPNTNGIPFNNEIETLRLSSTRMLVDNHNASNNGDVILYGGLQYDLTCDELVSQHINTGQQASRSGDFSQLRYGVKNLPGTLEEVNGIHDIYEQAETPVIVISGSNGTEESFKALNGRNINILHLATHGFYWSEETASNRNYVSFLNDRNIDDIRPEDYALLRSGLFFSGANIGLSGETLPEDIEDGILTAQELSNMNLGNVDMVVMSACQSGLGETSGEGVFGLQRGFKLAGARTLLMSLWKVDDEATRLLMTEFYRFYLSGKTKQESLCLAQQTLRHSENYSDPHYWAAFILLDALN